MTDHPTGKGLTTGQSSDYEVGYRKPPKHNRFKPGQSGNPRGRPKGHKNIATILGQILNEKVTLREGDRVRTVTKAEAMVMSTVNRALKGDHRAMLALLGLARETGQLEGGPNEVVIRWMNSDEKLL